MRMPAPAPLHVLVLTATAERARSVGRRLRERYPEAVLHGPFATVREAAGYVTDAAIAYAVVDHRVADGWGVDYWRYAPRTFARAVVLVDAGQGVGAYAKQSIATVADDDVAVQLPAAVQPPGAPSPATWMDPATARWCALDLEGHRPVYRRRIVQEVEPLLAGPPLVMPMPVSVVAHFYADGGQTWAAAVSGNLNVCHHDLGELEATLRPELWCRINERQLIGAVALDPNDHYDGQRVNLQVTSPLRDEVSPPRRAFAEQWLAGVADAYFDPDDEEELAWE